MKFYIGYDSAYPESAETCTKSLARFIGWDNVAFIETDTLRKQGLYWRNHNGTESTDFTYTRFLTPYLHGHEGTAVFCDGDFLWRKDPMSMLGLLDDKHAVQVVKHHITPADLLATKMGGKKQVWYPRKNWSSLMVFNTGHGDCKKLSPPCVSYAPPAYLHGFQWTDIDETPALPTSYNHLVGYYHSGDPVAVHFTDGGPWLPGYEDVEYAKEWFDVQRTAKRAVPAASA